MRLIAVAVCRNVWHHMTDERSRQAVEIAERLADSTASEEERIHAEAIALQATSDASRKLDATSEQLVANHINHWAATAASAVVMPSAYMSARRAVDAAAVALAWSQDHSLIAESPFRAISEVEHVYCDMIGEIFCEGFALKRAEESWLSWHAGTIPKLAESIYADRAFDRLPILADALEEAGCTDAEILQHCREVGPHVRGCWVVDLLLDKI